VDCARRTEPSEIRKRNSRARRRCMQTSEHSTSTQRCNPSPTVQTGRSCRRTPCWEKYASSNAEAICKTLLRFRGLRLLVSFLRTLVEIVSHVGVPTVVNRPFAGDPTYAPEAGTMSSTSVPESTMLRTVSLPPTSSACSQLCPDAPASPSALARAASNVLKSGAWLPPYVPGGPKRPLQSGTEAYREGPRLSLVYTDAPEPTRVVCDRAAVLLPDRQLVDLAVAMHREPLSAILATPNNFSPAICRRGKGLSRVREGTLC